MAFPKNKFGLENFIITLRFKILKIKMFLFHVLKHWIIVID
jgi:hypothetical protein